MGLPSTSSKYSRHEFEISTKQVYGSQKLLAKNVTDNNIVKVQIRRIYFVNWNLK